MKRQAEVGLSPYCENKTGKLIEPSSPGYAKEALSPAEIEIQTKENVEPPKQHDGSPAGEPKDSRSADFGTTEPTAKEIAAAKAARIRLGLEKPDGTEANEPASDEVGNLPSGEEPTATYEPEYPLTDQLTPAEDPLAALQSLPEQLSSPDWVTAFKALTMARRLTVHHQELVAKELTILVPLVAKNVKNLRSSVCKNGILCMTDMISVFNDEVAELVQAGGSASLLLLLLQKATPDKKFVMEEARRALATLAKQCAPSVALAMLVPIASTHKSPKVRAEAATATSIALDNLSQVEGSDGVQGQLAPLLKLSGALISDKQPEARSAARAMITTLCAAHGESIAEAEDKKVAWEKLCKEMLSASAASAVVKAT